MNKVGCTKAGCGCKGHDNTVCTRDDDVALFCKDGIQDGKCDQTPFLCPSDGTLPVGYVRAYMHKFLDCIDLFHGTGYASDPPSTEVPEFIVQPNMKAMGPGINATEPIMLTVPF